MPGQAEACPCGSGQVFGGCCREHLPGFDNGRALRAALNNRDLSAALIAARADVTQYIIWHRTNTEPLVAADHPVGAEFMAIDVPALADAVDELVQVHWLSGSTPQLMAVLERLRDAIRSPKWNRKVTYFQVLTEEVANDNPDAARREFAKLMPITVEEDDINVLQTCLSLHGGTMSFSRVVAVCDHIMRLSNKVSVWLQYTAVKASCYLKIDDVHQAGLLLDLIVAKGREAKEEEELDSYGEWLLAVSMSHLGVLKRETALFDEAIVILERLLVAEGWKPAGAERLHKQIGDCHRYAERWPDAEASYRAARALAPNPASTIFLAEVVLRQGRVHEAEVEIDSLPREGLDESEYEDLVFTAAAIAVETGDRGRMATAARRLEGFEGSAPHFERRRLLVLLRVKQAIEHGRTSKNARSLRRLLALSARSLSRYAVLEPNFSGLGLNLNRALDDLADRIDRPVSQDGPHPKG